MDKTPQTPLQQGDTSTLSTHDGRALLLQVENLKKHLPVRRGFLQRRTGEIKAVDGVTFHLHKEETLGLVGESGCGKTTTGRTILQIYTPTSGKVYLDGVDLTTLKGRDLRLMRRRIQMIFQDPYASLNPRMTVGDIVAAPLRVHRVGSSTEIHERVADLLALVGLNPACVNQYPHEFSGGQRQRIGIARALALNPDLIACDEPIAALDVTIQAQVINLLLELQEKLGLTYLFIAHDLSMVRHISQRIAVMYLGRIVEIADRDSLYLNPQHPYMQALLSAVPLPDPAFERQRQPVLLEGELPSPANPPQGCHFNTRCPYAKPECFDESPTLKEIASGHWAACFLVE